MCIIYMRRCEIMLLLSLMIPEICVFWVYLFTSFLFSLHVSLPSFSSSLSLCFFYILAKDLSNLLIWQNLPLVPLTFFFFLCFQYHWFLLWDLLFIFFLLISWFSLLFLHSQIRTEVIDLCFSSFLIEI